MAGRGDEPYACLRHQIPRSRKGVAIDIRSKVVHSPVPPTAVRFSLFGRGPVWRNCHGLILLACIGFFTSPSNGQSNPQRLTVASYNVQFLLDVFDDPYSIDEEHRPKSWPAIEKIAQVIRQMNPDVAVFQEIENEGVLKAMVVEMLGGMGYEHVTVMPTNSVRGQNLGMISRRPILGVKSHRFLKLTLPDKGRTWHFARDLMCVRIQATENHAIDIFVAHFKSKRSTEEDPQSNQWRLAEARATRRLIGESLSSRQPGKANVNAVGHPTEPRWVLLLGDLNDSPGSATHRALVERMPDPWPPLVDVHAKLPTSKRVTFLRRPFRGTIDYILADPDLVRRLVPGSARVIDQANLLDASDHAPVVVSFDLRD